MINELSLLDSLFSDAFPGTCVNKINYIPSVDVTENNEVYSLEMDLPGRTEDDVVIELDRNILTISSKPQDKKEAKEEAKEESKEKYLLHERRKYDFSRRFTLPENIDNESIHASFKNGVLTITMNKKEAAAPKKILITAA